MAMLYDLWSGALKNLNEEKDNHHVREDREKRKGKFRYVVEGSKVNYALVSISALLSDRSKRRASSIGGITIAARSRRVNLGRMI